MNRNRRRGGAADFLGGGGEMGARMRAFDWSASPLGPVQSWPQSLRSSVSTCLNCAFPILLWWGPDLVMLYNDECRNILGDVKHPAPLGQRAEACWPGIRDVIGPVLRRVMETGETARADDVLLEPAREGHAEECYVSFSCSTIRDETGGVGGVFTPVIETTAKVVAERRLRTLKDLAARRATSDGAAGACRAAAATLTENPFDIPFALFYLIEESGTAARLAGTAGILPGTIASPETVDLTAESTGGWPLAEVVRTNAAIDGGQLAERFGAGMLRAGAWPVPPAAARILPITPWRGQAPAALLVAAASPRKALDADHRRFLDLVADQVATGIAEAVAGEEERRRAAALAGLDRAKTAASNLGHEFRTPVTVMRGPLEDILAKPEVERLNARLEDLVAERTRALAEANERLRLEKSLSERLIESSMSGIAALDRDYRYTIFNPAMEAMTGMPRSRVLGRVIFEAFPFIADSPAGAAWRRAIERQEASTVVDLCYRIAETGRQGFYEAYYAPLYGSSGECIGALALVRETTERRRVEEQLRQAQRMEAIAQLTGGVAHDFNNLLMIVGGNLELMKQPGVSVDRVVGAIERAIARGQGLTRQLLTFSRRQALQPKVIDLAAHTPKLIDLLRPSLRGDIEVVTDLAPDLWPVEVDPGELELALLNIAVNARDAMPRGGRLVIGMRNERLDGGLAGDFVRIAVSDTGSGIPPEVLGRVFEPFFTTKEVGKGTGLGLSQVHGFATQSGGTATIASDERRGTTVTLYLPRSKAPLVPPELEAAAQRRRSATGTILLVEDNEEVAEVTAAMLETLGYTVARAGSARRALDYLERGDRADLVLTDIVMPGGTNGIDLARTVRERWPGLPVLLTTGYSAAAREAAEEGFVLLAKPYQLRTLEQLIRTALRRRPQRALG